MDETIAAISGVQVTLLGLFFWLGFVEGASLLPFVGMGLVAIGTVVVARTVFREL